MLSQYEGWTAEDIQRRHGCDSLTAMHVIQARAEFVEMSQRHADEIAALTRHLVGAENAAREESKGHLIRTWKRTRKAIPAHVCEVSAA
jgi:hypothetical protein